MSILITGISGHLGKIVLKETSKSKFNLILTYNKNRLKTNKKKNYLDKK